MDSGFANCASEECEAKTLAADDAFDAIGPITGTATSLACIKPVADRGIVWFAAETSFKFMKVVAHAGISASAPSPKNEKSPPTIFFMKSPSENICKKTR
jgi:hypothetical protein